MSPAVMAITDKAADDLGERGSGRGMSELSEGWCRVQIKEIAEIFLGKTPARSDYRSVGKLRVIKFRDLQDGRINFQTSKDGFVHDDGSVLSGLRELRPRDVLITSAAHLGENIGKKCAYVFSLPTEFDRIFFTGELLNIRCDDETLSRWVYFYFRSSDGFVQIQNAVSGVHLTAGRAKDMLVPVAPLNEQSRIIAKVEKLLTSVVAAQERLANIPRASNNFANPFSGLPVQDILPGNGVNGIQFLMNGHLLSCMKCPSSSKSALLALRFTKLTTSRT